MLDFNKFSIAQMTSNSDGKTSASGTMGCLCVVAGVIGFFYGIKDFGSTGKNDVMSQSIILITLGAGLLGFRKSKDGNLAAVSFQRGSDDPTEAAAEPAATAAVPETATEQPIAQK